MTAETVIRTLRAAGCVYAEDEAAILIGSAADPDELAAWVERRCAGEPLEQVVGWAQLCGLRIRVATGVFVPRRRSEFLAARACSRLGDGRAPVVVDLCCGAGALGAVILDRRPDAQVWATDIDPAAVACARTNLPPERVLLGDLTAALPGSLRGRVDLIVANAPYVPTAELATLPSEARDHEHQVALDGGADGLEIARRITASAGEWLRSGGHLLIETSDLQQAALGTAFARAGMHPEVVRDEELGAVVVCGTTGSVD